MDKPIDSTELDISYRTVSKAAVASCFFVILGALCVLISKLLVVIPLIGFALALIGLSGINKYPEEMMGRPVAKFGLIGSLVVFLGGTFFHVYDYLTEVPEGYDRISFRMLKDDDDTPLPFSEQAEALDGQKVFLKGFVRPGNKRKNLKDFILVGDFGSCCFGGSPKITDVVAISIQGDERINYSFRVRKIAGVFRLNREAALTDENDVPRVFYTIEADIVK